MKLLKELIPYVIIILVVVLIRTFIVTPVQVEGHSMVPTLQDNQILLLKKYQKNYKRFDIVVIDDGDEKLIKRIIGLPGETLEVKNNKLYINGKYVKEDFEHDKTDDFVYNKKKKIPEDIDYSKVRNIATEARQKLQTVRPLTIGQASRISGVNPSDITMLLVYLKKEYPNECKWIY